LNELGENLSSILMAVLEHTNTAGNDAISDLDITNISRVDPFPEMQPLGGSIRLAQTSLQALLLLNPLT